MNISVVRHCVLFFQAKLGGEGLTKRFNRGVF